MPTTEGLLVDALEPVDRISGCLPLAQQAGLLLFNENVNYLSCK